MKSKPFAKSRNERGFAGSLARGVPLALVCSGLTLLLLSFLCYKNADPSKLIRPFAAAILVFAAFLSGFLPARFYKRKGLLIGLTGGAVLALLFAVLSLILAGNAPAAARWIEYPAILLLSTFGGLLGGAKRHVRRRRPRF
jgi:putative membrane protein (TIGR04086 family)